MFSIFKNTSQAGPNLTRLSDHLSVTQQISPGDVPGLAQQGVRTIICNRPDREKAGQPDAKDIAAVAKENGMAFFHIPITPGQATQGDVDAFAKAVRDSEGRVVAFCASGNRSKSLAQAAGL